MAEETPAWLASAVVHMVLIVLLALWWWGKPGTQAPLSLVGGFDPAASQHLDSWTPSDLPDPPALAAAGEIAVEDLPPVQIAIPHPLGELKAAEKTGDGDEATTEAEVVLSGTTGDAEPKQDRPGGGFGGRKGEMRRQLAEINGATRQSEAAVDRGLEWLKNHQLEHGSWHFNHHVGPCGGLCRNPGRTETSTGSTSLALLAFLGAGQTHRDGEYQEVVQKGLYYLLTRMRHTSHGTDLQEGTMYSQGLATICLCEAYAVSEDPSLKQLAQGAVNFVVYAQDGRGGGWRYTPGAPGDTSVHGWQVMALRSAEMSYLNVPPRPLKLADRFLDTVQLDGGARYKYMADRIQESDALSAIGLLCRMYSGWPREHDALRRGVERIAATGPKPDDMYYNYYATQVMHHYGGPLWHDWNTKMRDYLVRTQERRGHENGSWYFEGNNGQVGGRLYNTALAIMTLEVYYRHLPLYREEAIRTAERPTSE